jgi:hypothetical protein
MDLIKIDIYSLIPMYRHDPNQIHKHELSLLIPSNFQVLYGMSMLEVPLVSLLYPSKNKVTFKITIELVIYHY